MFFFKELPCTQYNQHFDSSLDSQLHLPSTPEKKSNRSHLMITQRWIPTNKETAHAHQPCQTSAQFSTQYSLSQFPPYNMIIPKPYHVEGIGNGGVHQDSIDVTIKGVA
jgi:hypothetical protein